MPGIFLSYRRDDTQDVAGRIFDALVERFARGRVFKDVDSIPLGTDFREVLHEAISDADVVLVLIGPKFLTSGAKGVRLIDDPDDFVRIEVETAIELGKPIIPVIIGTAEMVVVDELPRSLRKLAFQNGLKARPDPDFHVDMDRLASAIEQLAPELAKARRLDEVAQRKSRSRALIIGVSLAALLGVIALSIACCIALGLADEYSASISRIDQDGPGEKKSHQPDLTIKLSKPALIKVDNKKTDDKASELNKLIDGTAKDNSLTPRIVPDGKEGVTEIHLGGGKKVKKAD